MTDELSPQDRAKALLEKLAASRPTPAPTPPPQQWDPSLIPDASNGQHPERDTRLQAVLDNIGVLEAYIKFIGKMTPNMSSRRKEGIMISCPFPDHRDANPSAWANTENDTWFCGGCQKGGDKFDLAAIGLGYSLTSYKTDGTFPKLAREFAENFGYTVIKGANESYAVPAEEANPEPNPQPSTQPVGSTTPAIQGPTPLGTQVAPVVNIFTKEEEKEDEISPSLFIPWEDIAVENTYLREWMNATTIDDLPHEFYFWLGLQALGFVGGTDSILLDYKAVKPNLYVCLYGGSGMGKSRSADPYYRLLRDVFPYGTDPQPHGVKILPTPNSAEFLIDQFVHEVKDATTQQITKHQIKGLVRYEELSALISKSFGKGSSLRETLIELYDVYDADVSTGARGTGASSAHNPFVQMLSTTQPNAIHAFLRKTDVESGFLNRWVFAAGKPRVAPIAYGGVEQDITAAAVHLRSTFAWAMNGNKFLLKEAALEVWREFFHRELARFKDGSVNMEAIIARIDLMLKKIIILLTLNEQQDQPTPEIVERALILYPYLKTTYSAFSADIVFDEATECQQRIIEITDRLTQSTHKFPTKNDVWRMLMKKYSADMVNKCFKTMIDLDILIEHAPKAGERGRPAVRYQYVGAG